MTDRMSVERARRLTDGGHHTVHTGLVMPAARTIVAQAAQITRLQTALRHSIPKKCNAGNTGIEIYYDLKQGDMEAPN